MTTDGARTPRRGLAALLTLLAALAAATGFLGGLPAAAAFDDRDDEEEEHWSDFYHFYYLLEMDRLRSQEEAAREQGRERRRAELEQERGKRVAEHEQYVDAKIEASRAALRAPAGAFYRRPGFTTDSLPAGAASVAVGGATYRFHEGVFFLPLGGGFVAVTAPVGAVVDRVPAETQPALRGSKPFLYYFGTFFEKTGDTFTVVAPPPGTVVGYLPDGYMQEEAGGVLHYRFGETLFRPALLHGLLVFVTAAP